ncbi:MAG TPA: M20/M25/M40 family metallo-hydrolase [Candidatus Sulfotelmatobacter sp.]
MASDAMRGRGSGTEDELRAANYLASELRAIGASPAGDGGGFVVDVSGTFEFRRGPREWHTRNVIGVLEGGDARLKDEVVMLSAHMDHLGVGQPVNGDAIYNGADDDASGCVAVLQLARAVAQGSRPKRTVLLVFFGSEETGGQGDQYFLRHPPLPLEHIVANLEFEMIGRPDAAVQPGELWLTGYDRSNLGPELAKHGARLVADPHPSQQFFRRSDNYALAKRGIIAQTVSSYGLHKDYHQPSDDIAHIDFKHMEQAIDSLIVPVEWLANSDFKPEWVAGGKP